MNQTIVTPLIIAVIIISIALSFINLRNKLKKHKPIQNGIRVEANILDIKKASGGGGGSVQYKFILTYTTKENEQITAETKQYLTALDISRIERTRKADIYYQEDKIDKVWIINNNNNNL